MGPKRSKLVELSGSKACTICVFFGCLMMLVMRDIGRDRVMLSKWIDGGEGRMDG